MHSTKWTLHVGNRAKMPATRCILSRISYNSWRQRFIYNIVMKKKNPVRIYPVISIRFFFWLDLRVKRGNNSRRVARKSNLQDLCIRFHIFKLLYAGPTDGTYRFFFFFVIFGQIYKSIWLTFQFHLRRVRRKCFESNLYICVKFFMCRNYNLNRRCVALNLLLPDYRGWQKIFLFYGVIFNCQVICYMW